MQLRDEWRAALGTICGVDLDPLAREGWRSRPAVEAIVGAGVVAELIAADLAVEWVHPDGPQLTLTPWGAWLLKVELAERNELVMVQTVEELKLIEHEELVEVDHWADEDDAPRVIKLPSRRFWYGMPFPDLVVDPSPGPDELAEASEGPALTADTREPIVLWGIEPKRRRTG